MSAPVFISYASKDRRIAERLCMALEARGHACWIAVRNVGPGENFQEAIVRAIRSAKVMVLVFTRNANESAEIKKEIVIAGRYEVSIVPVRIEDVPPNDALAYEFATRQWIDLFEDFDAGVERLGNWLSALIAPAPVPTVAALAPSRPEAVAERDVPEPAFTAPRKPHRPRTVANALHRASGIVLYAGMLLVAWWLIGVARGPSTYAPVHAFLTSVVGLAILVACAAALAWHMGYGIVCLIRSVGLPLPQPNPLLVWYQRVTAVANVPLALAFAAIVVACAGRDHAETVDLLRWHVVALTLMLFTVSVIAHMRIGMEIVIEEGMSGALWRPLVHMANTFYAVAVGLACVYAVLLLSFGA